MTFFHLAHIDPRDASGASTGHGAVARRTFRFSGSHFTGWYEFGRPYDGHDCAQIAWPCRSLRSLRSLRSARSLRAGRARFARVAFELLEDARLDLTGSRDEVVVSGDRATA